MSGLSEVATLFGQRAGDIEKAREVFTAETRAFVAGVLAGIVKVRQEPWLSGRVCIDLPREIETETKAGYLSTHFAMARVDLRFKKRTNFTPVAEARFGIEYDQATDAFAWQVTLVPVAKYQRIDDAVWGCWKTIDPKTQLAGSSRNEKANTVRFVCRPLSPELTPQMCFDDVKQILEFLLNTGPALADAMGLDLLAKDEE